MVFIYLFIYLFFSDHINDAIYNAQIFAMKSTLVSTFYDVISAINKTTDNRSLDSLDSLEALDLSSVCLLLAVPMRTMQDVVDKSNRPQGDGDTQK